MAVAVAVAVAVEAEHIPINSNFDEELQEAVFAKRGCCFWMPCLGSSGVRSSWWERITAAEKKKDHWWYKGLEAVKKMREWSELVAGPKWKTFIRRFNKHRPVAAKQRTFRYDPLSYSLNFDDGGQNGNLDDEDGVFRDFSSRYAMSAKSSMDLGKDGPTFT